MGPDGDVLAYYDKAHLVPFGEYLPFQETMEAIGVQQLTGRSGGFTPGEALGALSPPGVPPYAALICYELIFPGESRAQAAQADWIVQVTNDAWFGESAGPVQHLAQARVRAIELGLPVARAANTGISAVIDPYGALIAHLPLGTRGSVDAQLPAAVNRTLYRSVGDTPWLAIILISITFLLLTDRFRLFSV
jgi:apolipoprotein N-acyltransferase